MLKLGALVRFCPLSGVKRTCPFALHMSANDPKRTLRPVRAKRKRPGNRGAPKFQPVRASGRDLGRFDLQKLAGARDWDRPRLHCLRNLAHEVDV